MPKFCPRGECWKQELDHELAKLREILKDIVWPGGLSLEDIRAKARKALKIKGQTDD
jgi:hypothetical protein